MLHSTGRPGSHKGEVGIGPVQTPVVKIFPLLIFLLISFAAFSQSSEMKYPDLYGKTLSEVERVKGWIIIEKTEGYLNADQIKDVAVILQSGDHRLKNCGESKELLADEERIILVLISENDNPKVTIQNNKFIGRPDEGGMLCYLKPNISIKDNQFTLYYELLRGYTKYIFEYKNADIRLVKATLVGVSGGKIYSDHFDFDKKVIKLRVAKIGSDSVKKEKIPIRYDGYRKLSEFGEMYDWEVAEYKYL